MHKNVQSLLTSCFTKLGSIFTFVGVTKRIFQKLEEIVIAVFGHLHANISNVRNKLMFLVMKGLTGGPNLYTAT